MEFGKPSPSDLQRSSWSLPPDTARTTAVLQTGQGTAGSQKVYVGCAKWGRDEWVGKIYPRGTRPAQYLDAYGPHFNSVELNATNYKIPEIKQVKEWVSRIHRPDFLFCPKTYKAISFMGPSDNKARLTEDFLASILHFDQLLGPVFMTFSNRYRIEQQDYFFDYAALLRKVVPLFVEQRDPELFLDTVLQEHYHATLQEIGVGTVITDAAGRPDVLHMELTVPKAFIRFVGNSLHPSDEPRIDAWVARIKNWLDAGIEEVYFFLHMVDEGLSPELARYTVDQLNRVCGLQLPPLVFVS